MFGKKNKMKYFLADEFIADYDRKKKSGKEPIKTREGLAVAIGVSNGTISNWADKNKTAVPTITMAGALADLAGINYDTFVKKYMR